jgi:hypothetical protein
VLRILAGSQLTPVLIGRVRAPRATTPARAQRTTLEWLVASSSTKAGLGALSRVSLDHDLCRAAIARPPFDRPRS